jgi:hypothetical protein
MDLTYIRVHGKRRFVLPPSIGGRKPVSPMQCSSKLRISSLLVIALAGLLLMTACSRSRQTSESLSTDSQWHDFQGTWTATGSRTSISFGDGRRASTSKFEGSLMLAGPSRPAVGFRAEALVLYDTATGLIGRAVWTDDHGEQIFSELTGNGTSTGNKLVGTFVGGTGRYAGATGSYEFSWRFVLEAEDGQVQGQSMNLNGAIHVGSEQAVLGAGGPR